MFILTIFLLLLSPHTIVRSQESNLETYIVHVDLPSTISTSDVSDDLLGWYNSFLPTTLSTSNNDDPRIIYSYHNVFKGFAVRLTPEQLKAMENKPGFISAYPQQTLSLHTTHSPNFLGLNQNTGFWQDTNYGQGVIIGVLDTGIIPDHPSFSDEGVSPPPARWRGTCEFSQSLCNNKLIGARSFSTGNGTPLDDDGHGTHTASTAAGNFVRGANVFGNANGTAAGIAPLAHLAIYKVCSPTRCSDVDILAAMDAAIDDGVDVLSLSLGGPAGPFFSESVAVGAFSAIERGIFVSTSAGNDGPFLGSVQNGAPWVLTVGASTTDRMLRATAVLGNNEELNGESNYQPSNFSSTSLLPLVYPRMISNNTNARFCFAESLQGIDLQGRIVLCEEGNIARIEKGRAVRDAGGAAMILINIQFQGYNIYSDSHVLPATHLSYIDGQRIVAYINTTSAPTATISFRGTIIGDNRAPMVGAYSARGPNPASIGILKPDIIGPGSNILAGWSVSVENNPNTRSNFNIISGTSMSCPHLSGIAALLKNAHPDWSPAAIKSALMTTADQVNLAGNPIEDQTLRPGSVFATGAGHVNILRASNPGLVYDIQPQDYIPYLCGLNYTDQQVAIIVNRAVICSDISSIDESELNYPSFSVILENVSRTFNRTVTNVGDASSSYTAELTSVPGANITIEPTTLQFTELNQNLTYQVTFTPLASATSGTFAQGSLTWTSGMHSVRSPIVVLFD